MVLLICVYTVLIIYPNITEFIKHLLQFLTLSRTLAYPLHSPEVVALVTGNPTTEEHNIVILGKWSGKELKPEYIIIISFNQLQVYT